MQLSVVHTAVSSGSGWTEVFSGSAGKAAPPAVMRPQVQLSQLPVLFMWGRVQVCSTSRPAG